MKSPSSSVGIIESEGMRKGSNRNDRMSNTSRITGKNERAYSTTTGSAAPAGRFDFSTHASRAQIAPVRNVAMTRISAKSTIIQYTSRKTARSIVDFRFSGNHLRHVFGFTQRLLAADLQHRE